MVLLVVGGGDWLAGLSAVTVTHPGGLEWREGWKERKGLVWTAPDYFCNGHPSLTPFFSAFAAV